MEPKATRELGKKIKEMLDDSSHSWYAYARALNSGVHWGIINQIAFLVDEEHLEYASASVTAPNGRGKQRATIAVFTDSHVLHYEGDPSDRSPAFSVIPREALTTLVITSAPQVLENENSLTDGSMHASYILGYGDELRIRLPLSDSTRAASPLRGMLSDFKRDRRRTP